MKKAKPCQRLLSLIPHTQTIQRQTLTLHSHLLLQLLTSRALISPVTGSCHPGYFAPNLPVRETDVSLLTCNTQERQRGELVQWEHDLWIFHEYRGYFNFKYSQILHNFNLVAPLDCNIVRAEANGKWDHKLYSYLMKLMYLIWPPFPHKIYLKLAIRHRCWWFGVWRRFTHRYLHKPPLFRKWPNFN